MYKCLTRALLPIFVSLFVMAGAGAADRPRMSRPATESDLKGTWKQVTVASPNPKMDLSEPWYSGVQYYLFLGDGKLRTILSTGRNTDLTKAKIATFEKAPPAWSFKLAPNGSTVLQHKDGPRYLVLLETFVRDYDASRMNPEFLKRNAQFVPKKGDLAMTYFGKDKKPVFYRLLRRYAVTR